MGANVELSGAGGSMYSDKADIWGCKKEEHKWIEDKIHFSNGYEMVRENNHPRSHNGYIHKHILIAEKVLGRLSKDDEEVHHFPRKYNFTHLIICQGRSYHILLHKRHSALLESGHPNWLKCSYCKKYDSPNNLYVGIYNYKHRSCHAKYEAKRRLHK